MKFDENLAAIHAYLCADGYVIKNPTHQTHKYYHIALRNTNYTLLKDFQLRFKKYFGIKPHLIENERCRIQNKEIYYFLIKDFSYYSYEWKMPKLPKRLLKFWLRAFFDCESWVCLQPTKSRVIAIDCVNKTGLISIQSALARFDIASSIRPHRDLWQLYICGKGNIIKFQKTIGFLHPKKSSRLNEAINSYRTYEWNIPSTKKGLINFLNKKGKLNADRNELRFLSIKKENVVKLKKKLRLIGVNSNIYGPWKSSTSQYYALIIKEVENG